MKAHIIYQNYLNSQGTAMSVGGIQTYITNLAGILSSMGYEIEIYQKADRDFCISDGCCVIHGFAFDGKQSKLPKYLYEKCRGDIDVDTDILIFGCETMAVKNDVPNSIGIQHGIFWDKPKRIGCSKYLFFLDYLYQCYNSWKTIERIKNVKRLVCVDNNFVNWYRALVAHPQMDMVVIPNFSVVPELNINKSWDCENVQIMFARRFFDYRGTRIFAEAISKIIKEFPRVTVTLAGEGPDEGYLHDKLDKFAQVSFTKYDSSESVEIHRDVQIAVVPTTGSEGTSLSLLEAMASQCAVICTNVGGMTNVVIDGFNGLMISPSAEDLYEALARLVKDGELRRTLSERAYNTVRNAFSYDKWAEKWKSVVESSLRGNKG